MVDLLRMWERIWRLTEEQRKAGQDMGMFMNQ